MIFISPQWVCTLSFHLITQATENAPQIAQILSSLDGKTPASSHNINPVQHGYSSPALDTFNTQNLETPNEYIPGTRVPPYRAEPELSATLPQNDIQMGNPFMNTTTTTTTTTTPRNTLDEKEESTPPNIPWESEPKTKKRKRTVEEDGLKKTDRSCSEEDSSLEEVRVAEQKTRKKKYNSDDSPSNSQVLNLTTH
jgi:hypothetical protein